MSTVRVALDNLGMPQYGNMRAVFEKVLLQRSRQQEPRCSLFNLLARRADPLDKLNEDCGIYINAVGLADAQRRCNDFLMGNAGRPFLQFNGLCADFWAEMAAIRVLTENGYSQFRAIHKKLPDGSTCDYEAYRGARLARIEVKNMRPGATMVDAFDREIRRRYAVKPSHYGFNVAVDYPYDNPPTAERERRITSFFDSIRGLNPPFKRELHLGEAVARVTVREGAGTCMMIRGISSESPETLDKERFLRKVRDKAGEAYSQMKGSNHLKVLVINFDSPSGSISDDFILDAQEVMREVFKGTVDPYFLFYRQFPRI